MYFNQPQSISSHFRSSISLQYLSSPIQHKNQSKMQQQQQVGYNASYKVFKKDDDDYKLLLCYRDDSSQDMEASELREVCYESCMKQQEVDDDEVSQSNDSSMKQEDIVRLIPIGQSYYQVKVQNNIKQEQLQDLSSNLDYYSNESSLSNHQYSNYSSSWQQQSHIFFTPINHLQKMQSDKSSQFSSSSQSNSSSSFTLQHRNHHRNMLNDKVKKQEDYSHLKQQQYENNLYQMHKRGQNSHFSLISCKLEIKNEGSREIDIKQREMDSLPWNYYIQSIYSLGNSESYPLSNLKIKQNESQSQFMIAQGLRQYAEMKKYLFKVQEQSMLKEEMVAERRRGFVEDADGYNQVTTKREMDSLFCDYLKEEEEEEQAEQLEEDGQKDEESGQQQSSQQNYSAKAEDEDAYFPSLRLLDLKYQYLVSSNDLSSFFDGQSDSITTESLENSLNQLLTKQQQQQNTCKLQS